MYIILVLNHSFPKGAAQIITDGKHLYLDCKPFAEWNMDTMRAVRFHSPLYGRDPPVQYPHDFECQWKFRGTDKCTPIVYCERNIQIRSFEDVNCQKEFLRIQDGVDGENVYCGNISSKEVYLKPLEGRDLLVTFKADANPEFKTFFSGFSCTSTCNGDLGKAKPLKRNTKVETTTSMDRTNATKVTTHRPKRTNGTKVPTHRPKTTHKPGKGSGMTIINL